MKIEPAERVVIYGERRISYVLRFSDRKRLRIVVKPNLEVAVSAPNGSTEAEIATAVRSKAPWIVKQLSEFRDFHPLPTPHKFISGETFVYLGRQYRLKLKEGEIAPAKLYGRFLHVQIPDMTNSATVRRAVDAWYRTRASEVFRRFLAICMEVAGRHGVSEPTLTIREMRTRWGSCTAAGRVTLNLRLIHAPVHCIEYVVMHELCHLVHHDHSPQFFRLLTRCMPDWKKRRAVLSRVVIPNSPPPNA
jgi:predicted metal-dependent hydrolase